MTDMNCFIFNSNSSYKRSYLIFLFKYHIDLTPHTFLKKNTLVIWGTPTLLKYSTLTYVTTSISCSLVSMETDTLLSEYYIRSYQALNEISTKSHSSK